MPLFANDAIVSEPVSTVSVSNTFSTNEVDGTECLLWTVAHHFASVE